MKAIPAQATLIARLLTPLRYHIDNLDNSTLSASLLTLKFFTSSRIKTMCERKTNALTAAPSVNLVCAQNKLNIPSLYTQLSLFIARSRRL